MMGDVKGIPLFLWSLRQTEKLNKQIGNIIYSGIEKEAKVTDRMVKLLQLETERLLNNNEMRASERKSLEFCGMIMGEKTTVGKERKVGRVIIRDFESVFCNENIFIPDSLVNALDQNKEFIHEATSLRKSLEAAIYDHFNEMWCTPTKEELEAVIRSYPGLLNTNLDEILGCHFKTQHFIPLMAKLGLEHGVDVRQSVGKILEWFLRPGARSWHGDSVEREVCYCRKCANINYEGMMDELRSMNLFFKEDIEEFCLIDGLLYSFECSGCSKRFFAESRFRYLANWNPMVLTREYHTRIDHGHCYYNRFHYKGHAGNLPLHISVLDHDELAAFPCILELGLKHFPNKFGFLFHMNKDGLTPLAMAREKYGAEKVNKVVGSLLSMDTGTANKSLESLFVSLAIDESVHWEGVYIILRRDPSVLTRVLKSKEGYGNRKRKRKKEQKRESK